MPSAIEEAAMQVTAEPSSPTPPTNNAPDSGAVPAAQPTTPAEPSPPPSQPAAQPSQPAATPAAAPKQSAADRAKAHIDKVLGEKKAEAKPAATEEDDIEGLTPEEKAVAKSNPKAWSVLRAQEKKWKEKHTSLESKIAELSNKAAPTSADLEKLARLEKQLAEREKEFGTVKSRLAERDFRESDEYKKEFVEPWNQIYLDAYKFVSKLQVLDAEGTPSREATNADFDRIVATEPQQRRAVAKQLFGEDVALDVVDFAKELSRVQAKASKAVSDHAANYEKIAAERQSAQERERGEYGNMLKSASDEISRGYPQFFNPEHYNDKPELKQALEEGYAFLDNSKDDAPNMTAEDRAAVAAIVRGRAAAFVLHVKQIAAKDSEIESLKAELAKYRGSDPGALDPKPTVQTKAPEDEVGGISEMAAKFVQ